MADLELLQAAHLARQSAYAPYSHFRVGAAVRTRSGRIFSGCNVENASYGLTICAERVAIFSAICAGERDVVALALTNDTVAPVMPCGACRQVLYEFGRYMAILAAGAEGETQETNLTHLFPNSFSVEDLRR
jgi:cytidine deaminase